VTITYQDMKKSEIKDLKAYVSVSTRVLKWIIPFTIGIVVSLGVYRFVELFDLSRYINLAMAFMGFMFIFLYLREQTGGYALEELINKDIAFGKWELIEVYVDKAYKFNEIEDEGNIYLIQDKDGVWLLFSGQDIVLYERKGFPWCKFVFKQTKYANLECSFVNFSDKKCFYDGIYDSSILPLKFLKKIGFFNKECIVLSEDDIVQIKHIINRS